VQVSPLQSKSPSEQEAQISLTQVLETQSELEEQVAPEQRSPLLPQS
jgi:hypothetical protein